MKIEPYSLVTDGRRTGIVMTVQGAHATVSWEPKQKHLPPAWALLMRPIEPATLVDLRPIRHPLQAA